MNKTSLHQWWRSGRAIMLTLIYLAILSGARWLAYLVRFDFEVPDQYQFQLLNDWVWVMCIKLAFLILFGQYHDLLTYFSIPDAKRLFYMATCTALVLLGLRLGANEYNIIPKGVVLLDWIFSFVALGTFRFGLRIYREKRTWITGGPQKKSKKVAVIGAGDVGARLVIELPQRQGTGLEPIAFFDDDPDKWHSRIHGIQVLGPPEMLAKKEFQGMFQMAIIAMPSATAKRMGEIVKLLHKVKVEFATVPSLSQLATGHVQTTKLKPVQIEDVLGRAPAQLETDRIQGLISDKTVLVTGAGGSIGSELCRQVCQLGARQLLLVEQCEVQLFQIEQELLGLADRCVLVPLIADVTDAARMREIFSGYQPQIIYHAAAHKHVPMMEHQVGEAVKNNTFGTSLMADLASEFGAQRFIMISTDKAINPTSVMGATKRMAELYIQARQVVEANGTLFLAVRFGNVLGSSGSVVRTFERQIAEGGPVTVTHADMTRYFMTIPEAVGLVLQSSTMASGGEIFVLDMGEPVKIADLARQMIELSGLEPGVDIEIKFTGLRDGEKMFEELSYHRENMTPTAHPKIMRFESRPVAWAELLKAFGKLKSRLVELPNSWIKRPSELKLLIREIVPEYQPFLGNDERYQGHGGKGERGKTGSAEPEAWRDHRPPTTDLKPAESRSRLEITHTVNTP